MIAGTIFWVSVFMILYTYLGYPLLLSLLSRLYRRPWQESEDLPGVALLIAAYNEEAVIKEKLENSLMLDYPSNRLQIIVAADGSNDRTVEIVQTYQDKGIILSYSPAREGKMAAINRAMELVTQDIVVFSDGNNMYQSDVLKKIVRPYSDPEVGAVTGSKNVFNGDGVLSESESLYWKYESFIKKHESLLGSCTGVVGELFSIRSALFVRPPKKVINDDFYMAMQVLKQGYRVIYAAEARSYEAVSPSAKDEIVRRARIVAGRYQAMQMSKTILPYKKPLLVWQIISHKFLRPLVPFLMILALFGNIMAVIFAGVPEQSLWSLGYPYNWVFLGLQSLFYFLALSGKHIKGGHIAKKILYLPTFFVNSNFAALSGLIRYITGQQTVLWKRAPRRSSDVQ